MTYDKVCSERNLTAAFQQVAKNDGAAGVDHVSVEGFGRQMPDAIWKLSDSLKAGTFQPQAIKRVQIPKPGSTDTRPLAPVHSIRPTVRDRVVQAAIVHVIEPIFERAPKDEYSAEQSNGFRPGRGCTDALRRVEELLKAGFVHAVDADLKGYFDTIPHDRLMALVGGKITDGSVLKLIESFLQADILEGASRWTPGAGAPQGAVLSPLLSNIYLDPPDHLMARAGIEMVRYADDFVIRCRSAEDAQHALDIVRDWTTEAGLTLHPAQTKLVDSRTESFVFPGDEFRGLKHWPCDKSRAKLKDTLRGKTKRTSGESLRCLIGKVNQTLAGWCAHFQHSSYANVFQDHDQWLRMRLRSILRKRSGRNGRGRGSDPPTWTNEFFVRHGPFTLKTAHVLAVQSSRR